MINKQKQAINAWCQWYSAKLDRINQRKNSYKEIVTIEDYSGYEQDLYESFGCTPMPFEDDEE